VSIKNRLRGWFGEKMVGIVNWTMLSKKIYHQLNDITLELADGATTQIDHIVVSVYGIFVIETKNVSGEIYGSEKDRTWTKKIEGGRTYQFQNPLRQNYRHQCSLIEFLNLRCPGIGLSKADINSRIFSNVFFGPKAEVKTLDKLPDGVSGSVWFIKSKTDVVFTDLQVDQMVGAVRDGKLPNGLVSGISTRKKHIESLNERHNRTAGDPCPRCGEELVTRKRRKDGKEFVGCTGFPKCRYIKSDRMKT